MPLLIHLVSCWLAGLFVAAIAHAPESPWSPTALTIGIRLMVGLAAIAIAAAWRHVVSSQIAALATVTVAALAIGDADARIRARCTNALSRQAMLTVAIDARAEAGRRVSGVTRGSDALERCVVPMTVRVQSGSAPPGAVVSFEGTVRTTRTGLRLDGHIVATSRREQLRAWRGNAGERIDSLFGPNAALVRALLIADHRGIDPAVRDRFADAGLVHMLSISGLHVAIIASTLLTLASALRMSRAHAHSGAVLIVAAYVLILGAPAPAVRSAVMLSTVVVTERWQRPVHPWTALALGAVLPTIQPSVVLDLGWQLSVSGMAALVAAGALFRRLRGAELTTRTRATRFLRWVRSLRGVRWTLCREACTGVIATAVTAPLIAWTFGRVSLIAPLSNIAAGPVVAALQPALFVAMLLSPWPSAAQWAADACAVPLALLDRIATASASVPWAVVHVAPTLATACCAGVASAAMVRATASRRWRPAAGVAAVAMVTAIWLPLLSRPVGRLELHVLDVGQGDALALRTPRGRWVVIDAGRRWDGGDAGRRTVVPYLRRLGGDVAMFVLTHAHDDHAGGAASVVEALHPAQWWEPAFVTGSEGYRRALEAVRKTSVPWHRVAPGDKLDIDGVRFDVLAPDSSWTAAQSDANETSVVIRVSFGAVAFMLTGDAEASEEQWLVRHAAKLGADVLKLGHHGSKTSSSAPFLDAVSPVLGIVSVGADNTYGHPSPETIQAFAQRRIPLLRTDREGGIVVSTDGRMITVRTRRDEYQVDPTLERRER